MMRHLFWLAVALATALTAHAAFTLFVPGWLFAREVARMAASERQPTPSSSCRRRTRHSCFPACPARASPASACSMSRAANVTFSADLPDGFWVATIYTDKAEAIYSVNNRQSGSNIFNVSLSLAPGLIESLVMATDKERPEIDSGWTVMSPEPRGLAVVWYPITEAGLREGAAEAVGRSRCGPEKSARAQ